MGVYLDGRVSAVMGTHTHIVTGDERILPGGTAYVSGSATGTPVLDDRVLIWSIGTLGPGAGGVLSFQVKVSPLAADGGIIRNIASVSSVEQGVLVSALPMSTEHMDDLRARERAIAAEIAEDGIAL